MRIALAACVVVMLLGCGRGGDDAPRQLPPVSVAIDKAANGCLIDTNADAVQTYTVNGIQAQHYLWNCASFDAQTSIGVQALYTFNPGFNCFLEQAIAQTPADCSQRAVVPPNPPIRGATIAVVGAPALFAVPSGSSPSTLFDLQLFVTIDVTNTGDTVLFGTLANVTSQPFGLGSPLPAGDAGLVGTGILLPGQTRRTQALSVGLGTVEPYAVTLTVVDVFETPLASVSFDVVPQ